MKSRGLRREVQGVVKSAAMDKTICVMVERRVKHPVYHKYVRRRSTYRAHDEKNEASVGDRVRIAASRPISKTKHWRLVTVLEKVSEI